MRVRAKLTALVAGAVALLATASVGTAFATPAPAPAAQGLQEIQDFGENPTNLRMYLYVPETVAENPPVVVGVHWCHGNATDFYNGTQYATLADQYGFIVVYPSASSADGCWDVHTEETLTHDAGGDSLGIVSMVEYAVQQHAADADRVYATGISSGGMMTNVLLGAYPDVFQAGSAFAGVPFGCFAGPESWNTACATGEVTHTPQEWGDLVRAAYPGYDGPRPRMQLWHGTQDEVLDFQNFEEAIKQWTDVHGVSQTPTATEPDTPQAGWTLTRYGDDGQVEAIREEGQPHNLQVLAEEAIRFFGLS
jgi:acetylxylan esterase